MPYSSKVRKCSLVLSGNFVFLCLKGETLWCYFSESKGAVYIAKKKKKTIFLNVKRGIFRY